MPTSIHVSIFYLYIQSQPVITVSASSMFSQNLAPLLQIPLFDAEPQFSLHSILTLGTDCRFDLSSQ